MGFGILMSMAVAHAGSVVIHATDDTAALKPRVTPHLSAPSDDVSFLHVRPTDLRAKASWGEGRAVVECPSPSMTSDDLDKLLDDAEGQILYLELENAAVKLQQAVDLLVCSVDQIDPQKASRLGLLLGVVAIENGDKAAAFDHFSLAVRFDAEVPWNRQFSPGGERLLEAARQEWRVTPKSTVKLFPAVRAPHQIASNGALHPAPTGQLQLSEGRNWVQVQTEAGWTGMVLNVAPSLGQHSLYLPRLQDEATLGLVRTEEGRAELSGLVQHMVPTGTSVYLVHEDQLWRTASGLRMWENLGPESGQGGGEGKRSWPWIVAGSGVAMAVAGLLVASNVNASMKSTRTGVYDAASRGDIDRASKLQAEHDALRQRRAVGYTLAGVGGAIAASGLVLSFEFPSGGDKDRKNR